MREFLRIIVLIILVILPFFSSTVYAQSGSQTATIGNMRTFYDDEFLNVTITLIIDNMRGKKAMVGLWFQDESGNYIKNAGGDTYYTDKDGDLSVLEYVTPSYDSSKWEDFQLTIPINQFPKGSINIYPKIVVFDGEYLLGDFDSSSAITLNNTDAQKKSSYSDGDQDGLSDEFEKWAFETFHPIFEFDEEEHNIMRVSLSEKEAADEFNIWNGVYFLHQVSPVDCYYWTNADNGEHTPYYDPDPFFFPSDHKASGYPESFLLTVLSIYQYDYAPVDPIGLPEDDAFAHYGDTEVVRVCVEYDHYDEGYEVSFITTVRHSHEYVYLPSDIPKFVDGTHPYLYPSEGKHATYVTKDECRNAIPSGQDLGWQEDCGEGKIIKPGGGAIGNAGWRKSGNFLNVGEFTNENIELATFGIDGYFINGVNLTGEDTQFEYVWVNSELDKKNKRAYYFCGYFDIPNYSGRRNVIPLLYDSPVCAGSIYSKWWRP